MKATTFLGRQHSEVEALFSTAGNESGRDAKATSTQIIKLLLAHMLLEERLFYPAVRHIDLDVVLDAYEAHGTERFEMERVYQTEGDDDFFGLRLAVLKELIEHHIKSGLLLQVEAALDDERNEALGSVMAAQFEQHMTKSVDELFINIERLAPRPSASRAA